MNASRIPLAKLTPDPANPRRPAPDAELDTLVESIRARGLLLPLRVRPANAGGLYILVNGHRRYTALRRLGVETAECVVADGPPDEATVLAEQLTENLLREDLSPIDEAEGYQRYMVLQCLSATQAANDLHVPPARISRVLPLLELPAGLQKQIHLGQIPKDTAYYLSRLPEGDERTRLFDQAATGNLSRDEAARAAKAARPRTTASEPNSVRRFTCKFGAGRSLSVSAAALRIDTLIETLEAVLKEARTAHRHGRDVSALAKVFRDRAAAGGEA